MDLYTFCLQLETAGLLTEGVKLGVISPSTKNSYKMLSDYRQAKQKPGFKQSATLHELSVKYNVSYSWAYKVISRFS